VAVEARNLARLPTCVDHAVAAGAVISGLTGWQALFEHAHLLAGQTVLIRGVAGDVGSIAVQLAGQVGARVIGTGRASDRDRALALGVDEFVDLEMDRLEDAGEADVILDVIGGDILQRPTGRYVSAARSSPSPNRPRSSLTTGGRSSSSLRPIVPSSPSSPSSCATDD
jgi:NADPH:quinone reductase-like Zn-dependent oxidoreductase